MIRHDDLVLNVGRHLSPADGACLMELVSVCAGEPWSDRPSCTHPLLAHLARRVNDALTDSRRASLVSFIGPLVGATSTDDRTYGRIALVCTDVAVSRHPSLLLSLLNAAAVRRAASASPVRGHCLYNRGTAFRSVDFAVLAVDGLGDDLAADALQMMLARSLDAVKANARAVGHHEHLPQARALLPGRH